MDAAAWKTCPDCLHHARTRLAQRGPAWVLGKRLDHERLRLWGGQLVGGIGFEDAHVVRQIDAEVHTPRVMTPTDLRWLDLSVASELDAANDGQGVLW